MKQETLCRLVGLLAWALPATAQEVVSASSDTASEIAGIVFDDEDVLLLDGQAFSIAFDGSAANAAWAGADLDAVMVPEPVFGRLLLFGVPGLLGLAACSRRRDRRGRGPSWRPSAKSALLKLAPVLSCLVLASPAAATDGVVEINQTCAVQTGCFAGDAAGFPVTISGAAGKSYRLTSDLLVPDRNTTAIQITRHGTSLDLNGFEIAMGLCQFLNCNPVTGTGYGVVATGTNGVSVRNGSVTAMGRAGVSLANQAEVREVRTRWNGEEGINVGADSIVRDCIASWNGDNGIVAGSGSSVTGSASSDNEGIGIAAGAGSVVQGNTAYSNDNAGLSLGFGAIYSGNSITSNVVVTVSGGVNGGGNACDGTATCP